jgi:hypothetical protein
MFPNPRTGTHTTVPTPDEESQVTYRRGHSTGKYTQSFTRPHEPALEVAVSNRNGLLVVSDIVYDCGYDRLVMVAQCEAPEPGVGQNMSFPRLLPVLPLLGR